MSKQKFVKADFLFGDPSKIDIAEDPDSTDLRSGVQVGEGENGSGGEAARPAYREGLHFDGTLDEVFIEEPIEMIHAEQLDDSTLWIGVYLPDGERYCLTVHAEKKRRLAYSVNERPERATSQDAHPTGEAESINPDSPTPTPENT